LDNFAGKETSDFREAVKTKSKLSRPARTLKLFVAGPDKLEIDLDDMEHLMDEDGVFNFKQLVVDYKIRLRNPILVKFPGK